MAFAHARSGDLDKFRLVAHLFDGGAAAVAHAGTDAASHLEDDRDQRALVGDSALDPFGHQLVGVRIAGSRFLEIAVGAALLHGADRAHAAIALVTAALEQDDLSGRLLRAGEHAAHHYRAGAGRDGFGNIARVADPAVGDQRHAATPQRGGNVVDRGDLRHAHPGHDPGGADRTGPDPHFHRIGAGFHQGQSRSAGCDVAADYFDLRIVVLDPADTLDHALAVAMRGIDHDGVDTGLDQRFDPLFRAFADSHGRTDPQPPRSVARSVRKTGLLVDVFDGDQALQLERIVHHQQPLELVLVQQRLGLGRSGPIPYRDQLVTRRHDLADRYVVTGFEAQVASGDDAHHFSAVDHRKAGDSQLHLHVQRLPDRVGRGDDDRIAQHPGFIALDPRHFAGLLPGGEVLVDDAHAALLGDGDRQSRLRYRVHGGGDQRQIQGDVARQAGREGRVFGQDLGIRRHQQHVVERERDC